MNYTLLEDDVVTRLAPIVTAGYEVEAMPSTQADNRGIGNKGRITVQAGISKFDEDNIMSTSATTVQDEYAYVEVIIRSRILRETGGIYDLAELARRLLIGWTPQHCTRPFVGVDFGGVTPAELRDSVWTYSLRLKTITKSVGTPEADTADLIQQITFLPDGSYGPLMPVAELYASAYSVDSAGDQVILAWVTENGYEVEIDNGIGIVDAIGSATVTVNANVTYTITVTRGAEVATAQVELTIGAACDPVSIEINGTSLTTVASGGTHNQLIQNSASASIGTVANPSVIGDSQAQVNGVNTETIPATVTHNQLVQDSAGASVGTSANPSVIGDASVTVNGDAVGTVKAEGSINIPVALDGIPSGSWNGSEWDVESFYGTLISSVLQREFEQNIMMAFSLVYIKDNYSGAVINVRRSGDNTAADFTPTEITDGTLTAWVVEGGGTQFGYVTKIYDQSGNGFSLFNNNSAYQWSIVESGALVIDSQGNPTTKATSTQGWIIGSSALSFKQINFFTTSACSWAALKVDASVGNAWFHSVGGSPSYARVGTGTFLNSQGAGSPITKVNNTVLADQNRDTLYAAMAGNEVIINTIDIDFTAAGNWSANTQVKIGLSYPIGSTLSEFVLTSTDNSANQDYIFANRNAYYNYY